MYWKVVGSHRFKLNNLVNFSGKYIYPDNRQLTEYNVLCEKYVMKLFINVIIICVLMILSHVVIVVVPIYAYFFQDIRITPMATHLPFFEKDSDLEFMVNISLQIPCGVYGLAGSMVIELMSCIINNTITTIPHLIELNLKELTVEVKTQHMGLRSIRCLRNVLIQIQDFDLYVSIYLF